ncbi:hypothetical protein ILUMI_20587 [Ignelater luminosus]|uniref:Reverse transcriptase/retrotransposon-derived protein RNase H-like domain-containing protein n=1 Tax=Ignelater luminosus TaxID=2038154 RepID=A0A8K0G4F7_IGNLU|nr:hypothetical protein ILUMI_20587 [Ignelater luminosus]
MKNSMIELQFKIREVKYMGHIISKYELMSDLDKLMSMINMETPCKISAPLREIIKHDVGFKWGDVQQTPFGKLKVALSNAPVLRYFDPKAPVVLQMDAWKDGLDAFLMQDFQPIVYTSRALIESEKKFAQIEKELLSIVFRLVKFHLFVYGKIVTIQTDHKPLESTVNKAIHNIANTFSRGYLNDKVEYDVELESVLYSISKHLAITPERRREIQLATAADETLQDIAKYYNEGRPKYKH